MKKQTGYIYKRAGWWVLRYRENLLENGKIVRKQMAKQLAPVAPEHSRLKRPPTDIKNMAEDILRPLNRGQANPQATQTIGQFAENEFFPRLKEKVRQSTLRGYRTCWDSQLAIRCGDIRLRDFNVLKAQDLIDDVARQNPLMARRTLFHLKNVLSGLFRQALRLGFVDATRGNPARLIEIPRIVALPALHSAEPNPEYAGTYAYRLQEVETMLAVLPEPAATVCAVAAFAGLRRAELRGVRWEDYDGKEIKVMHSVWEGFTNEPKTESSKAPVPVIARLRAILAAHKVACGNPKSGPMFANGKGKPANLNNTLNRQILPVLNRCRICRKAKGQCDDSHTYVRDGSLPEWHGFHAFRRGLATALYALGCDDLTVQKIMRHQNVTVTREHYIQTSSEQSVTAMNKFEAALPVVCADRALESMPVRSVRPN